LETLESKIDSLMETKEQRSRVSKASAAAARSQTLISKLLHCGAQRTHQNTFVHNFSKCWPIFNRNWCAVSWI